MVINTAKYLSDQPLVAFNPDPQRIGGLLIPFAVADAPGVLGRVLGTQHRVRRVTLAKATLNDGQKLYAVNDLFIGHRSAYPVVGLLAHPPGRAPGRALFVRDYRVLGCRLDGLVARGVAGAAGVMAGLLPASAIQPAPSSAGRRAPAGSPPSLALSEQVRNAYAFDATAWKATFSASIAV